jgi:hypothetical protein
MGTTHHPVSPAPVEPQTPDEAPAAVRRAYIDEIIVALFALLGIGGAAYLPLHYTIPPITTSFLLATGLAALTYRFLGGIQGASFAMGSLKLGGTLGAMVGIAVLINQALVKEQPTPHEAYHLKGQVVDDKGQPVPNLDVSNFNLSPPTIYPDPGGNDFQMTFTTGTDFNGNAVFPKLEIKYGTLTSSVDLGSIPRNGLEIPLGTIRLHPAGSSSSNALTPAAAAGQTAALAPTPEKRP